MKHTQGNWHIIGKSEMDGIEIGIDNKDGTKCPIAKVNWYGEDDYHAEEGKANARLVSAAPDLLAACKSIASWNGKEGKFYTCDRKLIEQAIAKTEP